MVTVQDIGLQLTKPVKELAQWNFPFSETLEQYCSLFNATTCNKGFGEAGLVLQNSTAVYVHRVESLWTKTEDCRNVLSTHEQEEAAKNHTKKRDRKADMFFHEFKTVNFAAEVDKNIDIKKNHTTHDNVKCRSRRFPQLEKTIAQHVSIDIYDVNGEVIGKKYDFRCNQNISMDGILVDEFAPRDFHCDSDISDKEKSLLNSSYGLCDTSMQDSTIHDDNDDENNTEAESERDNDSPEGENSDLVTSFETSQQNLSCSRNAESDNTLMNASCDSLNVTLANTPSQSCRNTPIDTHSPITNIENTILSNNNDFEDQCLNNNIKESIDVGSLLDSPPESVNSKGTRTSSTDDPASLNDTNGDLTRKSLINSVINTSLNDNKKNKTRQRSTLKSKLLKRKLLASCKKRQNVQKKNLLHSLEDSRHSRGDRPSMFKATARSCMKCIREYDPSRYEEVTNAESDLLGFRLHVNNKPDVHINNECVTNINDNVTTPPSDDEISELHSPTPTPSTSPPHESFCDVWFRSDSPRFSSDTVDKWHEMIQPKLRDAERRSVFCIRDYASRIMETLKANGQGKINFDTVVQKERPCEVARYFLASLDLASKRNVNINTNEEHNIEIALYEDEQCSTDSQADSHD
ncbi:uncharacterized protein LOC105830549 isoform X2 [Monomorium pharaonis]|nr:uncharacterized protein LOC105830549 isoform X2 [Monomorium pharaonis]XP_028048688.2 uncharacterized protein LOC105830549 isoform X2 [Monomorium pharaonis]XP_036145976.1 uncharacterized protein LOC105830549 isoform X2 [Monomorium pharaonis]